MSNMSENGSREQAVGRNMEGYASSHTLRSTKSSRLPPFAMMIRKTSIVGFLVTLLMGLLWCMNRQVRSIRQWQRPSGEEMDPLCWPVVKAYLLLVAELSVFLIVAFFVCMIPTLVMTWITVVVLDYLFHTWIGKRRREKLIRWVDLAKEMFWSALKKAAREGNIVGVVAIVTLCLLPWMLGMSNIFAGQSCG